MFRKNGFTVTEASDGTTALDSIRALQNHMDLLLLDTLPGASSREVFDAVPTAADGALARSHRVAWGRRAMLAWHP
jgi:DNA-binding response OmpR family regulator